MTLAERSDAASNVSTVKTVETQPIVIAGAGPAGCVAALYLAQQGIPVVLLEREADLPIDLRASTFHPPTLEMFQQLGIAEPLVEMGLRVDKYQYRDRRTQEVAEFDMSLIAAETDFPFRLQLEQYELTRMVVAKLADYPHAEVCFNHEFLGLEQTDSSVLVRVGTPGGEIKLETPFLIGADGASSEVRKALKISYLGFTYDEKFLVVSTPFPFEEVFDNLSYVNYVADPDEWCVILRTDKLWRVLWPTNTKDCEGKVEQDFLSDEFIQEKLHRLYDKEGDYEIGHRTLYNVHQRVAETYFDKRVALVGDACHINNPLGGMGMNGGIHDAFNLAEKLTRIICEGEDYQPHFERYNLQRRDLAVKFVQEHTINNKKMMEATDEDVQNERQRWLMETSQDPEKAFEFIMERAMFNCLRESLEV